ncbi:BspA family leucine-rich repeat surface protein [Lactococcus nasutitermitis]|uniref:BspA family leucine-rich repeat surface protein n=1 Tax=Lactococcus nasutitermitis TaxID=1652957 RepID=A0ABV9JD01_9LACT|nr:BspA family leucine-rich repeat surface protein [Lactococcus nasutitermitis]
MQKKTYLIGARRRPTSHLREKEHFRTWKQGKHWLYASSTLLILGGSVLPAMDAVAETVEAQYLASNASTTTSSSDLSGTSSGSGTSDLSDASSVPSSSDNSLSASSDSKVAVTASSTAAHLAKSSTPRVMVAAAADTVTGTWGGATWTFDSDTGTLSIQGNIGDTETASTLFDALSDGGVEASNLLSIVFTGPTSGSGDAAFKSLQNVTTITGLNNLTWSGSASEMFAYDYALTSADLSGADFSGVTDMSYLFIYNSNLQSVNLSWLDTALNTRTSYMFFGDSSLTTVDLSGFDTSSVFNMDSMFNGDSSIISLDVSDFDTSHVGTMPYMFQDMSSLKTIIGLENFDTSNVTYMLGVFSGDTSLTSLDLSSFTVTPLMFTQDFLNITENQGPLGDLKSLVLGPNVKMNPNMTLPDITPNAQYTGYWQNIGDGTADAPKGSNIWTSQELMTNYTGAADQVDTYVWQPALQTPTITTQDITIDAGSAWTPEDNFVSATDEYGNPLTLDDLVITSTVDTAAPGTYNVTYSYTDVEGDTVSQTATITVVKVPESSATSSTTSSSASSASSVSSASSAGASSSATAISSSASGSSVSSKMTSVTSLASGASSVATSSAGNSESSSNTALPKTGETETMALGLLGLGLIEGVLGFEFARRKSNK